MLEKISLTPKIIYEKEFKTSMKGYNQEEVDQFLDVVMRDYDIYTKVISALNTEIDHLRIQLEESRKQASNVGATNFDILKRISNLEKAVFGDKLVR